MKVMIKAKINIKISVEKVVFLVVLVVAVSLLFLLLKKGEKKIRAIKDFTNEQ